MAETPFEYYVGKERLQVQVAPRTKDGPAVVEYRDPGDPLPEAAEWGNSLDRYIDLGLVVRVRRLSDDELVDEARRRGLLNGDTAQKKPRRRRGRRRKQAADTGQPQKAGAADGGEQATGEGGADAAPPADGTPAEHPQHVGGGMYELSDGSRVRGKAKAAAAQSALTNAE